LGGSLDDLEEFVKKFGYRAYMIPEESIPVRMSALTDMEVLVFRA